MTAVVHPLSSGATVLRRPAPAPRATAHPRAGARQPAGTVARSNPKAAQFRRRRFAAAASFAVVLLGGVVALGDPGEVPLTASGAAPAAAPVPVARATYVVRPGDTLWQIARALQPSGDLRPLVQRLAAERHGAPLRAGERLALPVR